MQAVRSVTSGGKFYRLPPDKENTAFYPKRVFIDGLLGLYKLLVFPM